MKYNYRPLQIIGLMCIASLFLMQCLENGAAGPAGPAGEDGEDGVDGNANVLVKIVQPPGDSDFFPLTETTFLGQAANRITVADTLFTPNRINNWLIRTDVMFNDAVWRPLPLNIHSNSVITFAVTQDTLSIYAFREDSALAVEIEQIRYFLIESSN